MTWHNWMKEMHSSLTHLLLPPSYLRNHHLEPRGVSIQLQWEYQRLSQKIWCLTIKQRSFWSVTVQIWHLAFKSNSSDLECCSLGKDRSAFQIYALTLRWRVISLGNWWENSRTLLTNSSWLCQTRDKRNFAFLLMLHHCIVFVWVFQHHLTPIKQLLVFLMVYTLSGPFDKLPSVLCFRSPLILMRGSLLT